MGGVGATCPERERALSHGEQGSPQVHPMPTNSHEISAHPVWAERSCGKHTENSFQAPPVPGPAPGPGPVSQVVVSIPRQNAFRVAGSSERDASCTKACGGPLPGTVRWGRACPEPRTRTLACPHSLRLPVSCPLAPPPGETRVRATTPPPTPAQTVPFDTPEKPQRERNVPSPT